MKKIIIYSAFLSLETLILPSQALVGDEERVVPSMSVQAPQQETIAEPRLGGKQVDNSAATPVNTEEKLQSENFSDKFLSFCFQFCCWPCLIYLGR